MYLIFVDGEEVSQKLKVKVKDAHNLPNELRVVVNYDDKFQPIGEASGLLVGLCRQLAINHVLFPISFEKWSTLPDTYKDIVWKCTKGNRTYIEITSVLFNLFNTFGLTSFFFLSLDFVSR